MKAYLPFTGEFGGELLKVVPRIHGDPEPKLVFCERGKRALYPSATEIVEIQRVPENYRGTTGSRHMNTIFDDIRRNFIGYEFINPLRVKSPRKWFVPKTETDYEFKVDICLFPRKKTYRASMNWDGWTQLVLALQAEGLTVFAAGHRDSTEALSCPGIWDYEEHTDLDVSIWAIQHSKVRIGLLTALHVLGLMCGMPVTVLMTGKGRIHPKANARPTLSYLMAADHLNVGFNLINTFDIEEIVHAVVDRCSSE